MRTKTNLERKINAIFLLLTHKLP